MPGQVSKSIFANKDARPSFEVDICWFAGRYLLVWFPTISGLVDCNIQSTRPEIVGNQMQFMTTMITSVYEICQQWVHTGNESVYNQP